jgi:hypothetical protein
MITRRQKACGWSFIVIAPNAASLAFKLGMPVTHARNWKSDPDAITGLLEPELARREERKRGMIG